MMRVILQEDVPNLGEVGELVAVRDGYARNFLIPQGKAVFASMRSMRELEHQKRVAAFRRTKLVGEAEAARQTVEKLAICMHAKVAATPAREGEPEAERLQRLHGSITNRDLVRVLGDAGVKTDHRRVTLAEPVRTVGKFSASIRLDGGLNVEFPFWVIPEGAGDVEAEKKRVEAAQEAARKAREEARQAAAAAAKAAPEPMQMGDESGADGAEAVEDGDEA